jgi:FXSXX-COOH protein
MTDRVTPLGDDADQVRMNVMDLPLDQLLRSDDSVLAAMVQRVLVDVDGSGENYAAFGSVA